MRATLRAFQSFAFVICASALFAQNITQPSGVSISISGAGDFSIQSGAPAWTYSGKLPGQVTAIGGPSSGSDNNKISTNGLFDELTVTYSDARGDPWRMQLRAYRSIPSATISFSPLATVPNQGPYAVFTQFPITQHHFSNGGWNRTFGPLSWMYSDSPWLFFDDQFRASILSAASHPISQRQKWVSDGSTYGSIGLAIDSSNAVLPAGAVYTYVITFDQGIGKVFDTWGRTLTNILGKPRQGNQADLSLIMPMLSTDAGASYYYSFDPALGYEGTLEAAIASAKSVGILIGVVHFDSWWYLKGGNCSAPDDASFASWQNTHNGVWKYVADPALFQPIDPNDPEEGFVQNLGPGMAHGRWIDACSPYRIPILDTFRKVVVPPVSGNVIIAASLWGTIARALKRSGMVIFEQDFLSTTARAANTFDDEKFLNALAAAMGEQDISLQYCMPIARHLLAAFQYPGVHTIRVSGDRFGWSHWDEEMYGSLILNAGSVWPTVDNFRTAETRNLLLAALSAGPLALGDQIGEFVPIDEAIRSDGLILKPDVSMVPTDASIANEATTIERFYGVSLNGSYSTSPAQVGMPTLPPLVAYTYSDLGTSRVAYVFAYSRDVNATAPVIFSPQELGFSGEVYVYNYFSQTGQLQPAARSIESSVDSQGSYFVIAPVGQSKIAFVGDLSKFVPASKQRVMGFTDNGQITVLLQLNPGEDVPLWFFAPSMPAVSADQASISAPTLDSVTGLYKVTVKSGAGKQATIRITPAN